MWRTCRIVATWQCGLWPPSPVTYMRHFPSCNPSPTSLPPAVPLLFLPNRPQYVLLPSLCSWVLIVQHPPMSKNTQCLIFCSCVSLLRMMVSRFIHVPTKDTKLIVFYGCIVFHGVYVPHFPCPYYHRWAFGLVPGLCYYKQCRNEHMCVCVFIIEWFIILWVYTQ